MADSTPPLPVPLAFNQDGTLLALSERKRSEIVIVDVLTRAKLYSLKGKALVSTAAFSPDGRRLVTAEEGRVVRVWDLEQRRPTASVAVPRSVRSIVFRPGGNLIALAGMIGEALLWDLEGETVSLKEQENSGWYVSSVAFSPDGKLLASGNNKQQTITIWDVASRKQLKQWPIEKFTAWGLAFSRDGSRLAAIGRAIQIWDTGTWERLHYLPRLHSENVDLQSAAFTPDDERLLIGLSDGRGEIWDPHTGRLAITLRPRSTTMMRHIAFPEPGVAVTASGGGMIRYWDFRPRGEGELKKP